MRLARPRTHCALLDDDVEWSLGGPVDLLPFCGQRHGKSAVIDTIVRLAPSSIRLTDMEPEEPPEIAARGNRIAL